MAMSHPPPASKDPEGVKATVLATSERQQRRQSVLLTGPRFSRALQTSGIFGMSPMGRREFHPLKTEAISEEEFSPLKSADRSVVELQLALRRSVSQSEKVDLTVIPAREAVRKMIQEFEESVAGVPNQRMSNGIMLKELQVKFRCDPLVAKLACMKANFENIELAVDFIYGHDPMSLHKHAFVPFQINERELQLNPNVSKDDVDDDNLMSGLRSPDFQKAVSAPIKNIKSPPLEKRWKEDVVPIREAFAETSDIQQTQFKIRCFICKGKKEHHWNEERQSSLALQELNLMSKLNSIVSSRANSPSKALRLSRRQESFYSIRDSAAQMALKLRSQFSDVSPTKLKRVLSQQDDQFFKISEPSEVDIEETFEESLLDDYCPICYVNKIVTGDDPVDEATFEFSCQHRFCVSCCEETLRCNIINNELHKLKCPEVTCKQAVSDQDINRLFYKEPQVMSKLRKWQERAQETSNMLLRYCTKPRCDGKMIAADSKVQFVTCPICATKVCFDCRDTWHHGLSCDQNMEWVFQRTFGMKKNVSFCPMCKTRIERMRGCNHMTCGFCLYEFCWVCHRGATAGSGHWDEFSLTGCGAAQLDGSKNPRDLERLSAKRCSTFACIFFCFPVLVIFYVPWFLAALFLDKTEGCMPSVLRYFLVIFVFLVGIPLGVAAIPFAIIFMIYKLIHDCCYVRCCKKSRNQLQAEELLRQRTETIRNSKSIVEHGVDQPEKQNNIINEAEEGEDDEESLRTLGQVMQNVNTATASAEIIRADNIR